MGILEEYKEEQIEKIKCKYEKELEKAKERPILEEVSKMGKEFEQKYHELFLSQFTPEEKENFLKGIPVDTSKKDLVAYNFCIDFPVPNTETEKEMVVRDKIEEEKQALCDFINKVASHVSIAETKEETEEILIRYGILDKKTKMISEEIWTAKKN